MTYAKGTTVSAEQSRGEIEQTIARFRAEGFAYAVQSGRASVQFIAQGRRVRFDLELPDPNDQQFTHYTRGTTYPTLHKRTPDAARKEWEQAVRQLWRALALSIKAKLAATEAGISSFEDEFLAYTVMPDGRTVAETIHPQINRAYELGTGVLELMAGPR